MKKLLLFGFLLIIYSEVYATHNRAGEITYQYISGYTYNIIVTTYTNTIYNNPPDFCELMVYFGDVDSAYAIRTNGPTQLFQNGQALTECDSGIHDGVIIDPARGIKQNIYQVTHTFPGSGDYIISMNNPNRNAEICNIPNSVGTPFYIQSELLINPFLGPVSSPTLLNPPIDDACAGECYIHNPGAYDADGDSLSYSLVSCMSEGAPIYDYALPINLKDTSIDPLRGNVNWCSPTAACGQSGNSGAQPYYVNIAILIKAYRKLPGSYQRYYAGSVERDMQITVNPCPNNNPPPSQLNVDDTCIVAGTGTILNLPVTATNSSSYPLTLSATGGPLEANPAATFSSITSRSPVKGTFSWSPDCSEVQLLPYSVVFKVIDATAPNPLATYKTAFIRVIAPAPTGLTAAPINGSSIVLNWNSTKCSSTSGNNPLIGYSIYRKNSCDTLPPSTCVTGVPSTSGYTLIGSTGPSVTTYTDNNNGQGLSIGVDYSYIVVADYSDGAQSYPSKNVCAKLVRDIPVITNVSVLSTGTNDSIWVHWVKPIGTNTNVDLDTITYPPPYRSRLMQALGFNPLSSSFDSIASYTYPSFWQITDTGFVSKKLNTEKSPYSYRVDFYSNRSLVGSTSIASSVYLSASPSDHKINLSWQQDVPWSNYQYKIYRETAPGSLVFHLIDSTASQSYTDTGLVNLRNYCYKIVSIGQYADTTILHPLYNDSEIKCAVPIDTVPPCQPTFTVTANCETATNLLFWTDPNYYCSTAAFKYYIYFAYTTSGTLQLIDSILNINTTTFSDQNLFEGIPTVAGCYAVTVFDSSGYQSRIITKKCVDNCPIYVLPNVFTPNGDKINDLYTPIAPYRYILNIDIKIFNRWGTLVFETTNTDILWDGKDKNTKLLCPEGTYFYICTVNEIHVEGIESHVLKGFLMLINGESKPGN